MGSDNQVGPGGTLEKLRELLGSMRVIGSLIHISALISAAGSMPLLFMLLGTALSASGGSMPHILSDTPSWLRLRPTLTDYFADDMDATPLEAAAANRSSAGTCDCSGRGRCFGGATCSCNDGYTGSRCEFAGPAWASGLDF